VWLAGSRQGLKGLKFTAKLKKAMGDRRQSRFGEGTSLSDRVCFELSKYTRWVHSQYRVL